MQPSCYQFETSAQGSSLYLGETSTGQALREFPESTPVTVLEFGAAPSSGEWFSKDDLPSLQTVAAVIDFLGTRPDLELVDFTADVGGIRLSTHDDSEVHLVFSTETDAVAYLRQALGSASAESVVEQVLGNSGRYVSHCNDTFIVFDTFEDYLRGT